MSTGFVSLAQLVSGLPPQEKDFLSDVIRRDQNPDGTDKGILRSVYIYALSDPETGVIRYVGKANDPKRRLRGHYHVRGGHRVTRLQKWLFSLRSKNKTPVIQILEITDFNNWQARERHWVVLLRKSHELFNFCDGGNGCPLLPEEVIEKTRLYHLGRKRSPETRAKMSEANKRRKYKALSEETRTKMSLSHKGKQKSAEHLANIGNALRGRKVDPQIVSKVRESHIHRYRSERHAFFEWLSVPSDKRIPPTRVELAKSLNVNVKTLYRWEDSGV